VKAAATTLASILSVLVAGTAAYGQQTADPAFVAEVRAPAFGRAEGPVVAIDEAHFNFHTADGRYAPFADLLRRDGFVVAPLDSKFSAAALADIDVLVIANALNERNVEEWSLPTPSAFAPEEIAAVRAWVDGGGALLLIADHMPFGGAASELASAFGFSFTNGYANRPPPNGGALVFKQSAGLVADHPIVRGRNTDETIEAVTTFTGQAFDADGALPLFVLADDAYLLLPEVAGEFSASTPRSAAAGKLQAATKRVGAGRVAAFGEAAMFTAQLGGPARTPFGMNAPGAEENAQFVLNVMHWLAGLLAE
jgi:hypothetical protein